VLRQESARRPTILTLHRTAPLEVDGAVERLDDVVAELNLCTTIIVHQESERGYLKTLGVTTNIRYLPIGSPPVRRRSGQTEQAHRKADRHAFVVGTYGFLLPHKGLLYLLDAVEILRSRGIDVGVVACCAIHPDPRSTELHDTVRERITQLGLDAAVELHTEYLPNDESLALLEDCDVIVLPYAPTTESSSAALRSVLPLARPIITSDITIFQDVKGCVRQIPSPIEPELLADELEYLWLDDQDQDRLVDAVHRHIASTSWPVVGRATKELYVASRP
jgi:glycosyltransferase involved in cell wall biosynthesis